MTHTVTVHLPEDIYDRLKQSAQVTQKPMEELVVQSVRAGMPPLLSDLPAKDQEAFLILERLSDEELWQVAKNTLPAGHQRRYSYLLRKNQTGTLTEPEEEQLSEFGAEARNLTLRKAYAYALLKWRGHRIPTPSELRQP